ncbi:MAG TPA: GntR family transcriptional regulator [Pyrinomonadaceae bacterium]|jgi:DNA-binding GntR family transcriptional regulator|nr:GntR family transcriptional regulator [Pyrinomonadaceae bacterium]
MQYTAIAIARDNISDSVVAELRNMIVDGRLPEGDRINEVHLAQQLGVSRTPLREALARLEHEGALKSVSRIGYFVRALTVEEFEQIYAIRPLLDPEALRLAGVPSSTQLKRLEQINAAIERESEPDTIIRLDDEFHLGLVAGCPNKVLIELIEQFSRRTRRYELALMRERKNVRHTIDDHERVLTALRKGDLEAACGALKQNMFSGRAPIVEWLKERGATIASEGK